MRTCSIRGSTVAAIALALSVAATAKAAVVYEETFGYYDGGTGASGQTPYFGYDWDAQAVVGGNVTSIATNTGTTAGAISFGGANGGHVGGTGTNPGSGTIIGTPFQTASAGPIYYTAAQAANRNATNDTTGLKYGLAYNNVNDGTVLDYTKEYATYSNGDALNTVNHPGLTFSWFEGNNDANGGYSLAVEVGGQWYVTTTVYKNEDVHLVAGGTTGLQNGGFENNVPYISTGWDLLTFNGDYTFTPNTEGASSLDTVSNVGLARGTTGQTIDTTQNIQAFGLFSDANTAASNRRFDSFTITDSVVAAPEPASIALLGAGAFLMLRRKRA